MWYGQMTRHPRVFQNMVAADDAVFVPSSFLQFQSTAYPPLSLFLALRCLWYHLQQRFGPDRHFPGKWPIVRSKQQYARGDTRRKDPK
jgi:hypothetical protein